MLRRNDKYYENIDDLSGISKNHPILSICLLITLFSLAGIPPLAGFFAKFYIFLAVIEKQMYFLAIVGLLSTVVAAFYYLRIIKKMYFDEEKEKIVVREKINKDVFDDVSRIISFISVDGASNAALIQNEFITSFPQVDAISIQRL